MRRRAAPHELEHACAQALYEGARSAGAGSRQQVRAAVRRFVRRHRRDRSYLHQVLRAVLASSAFAVALLGLGLQSAEAASTLFAPQTGPANPLTGFDAGRYASPALGDIDGDGDLDLVAGDAYGALLYFENTGSATTPLFLQRLGTDNPLPDFSLATLLALALADLDGDGDLDLVAGNYNGGVLYYANEGSATAPDFVQTGPSSISLFGGGVPHRSAPSFGDLDGDGDLDLVVGDFYGTLHYYENIGDALAATFLKRTGSANPLDGQASGLNVTPSLGDLDGDGDLDLVAGTHVGAFSYHENTGSATSPTFVERTAVSSPLVGFDVGAISKPALGDLDADGDLDLVTGEDFGAFFYHQNLAGRFVQQSASANPLASLYLLGRAKPALGDLDGDGDLDLVASELYGTLLYFENTGSAANPVFVAATSNPLAGIAYVSAPALGDLDGDGDLDLVADDYSGSLVYMENTGDATTPTFVLRTGAANPFDGLQYLSAPTLGDLDDDGDLDLVVGRTDYGEVVLYENVGTAASPAFAFASANPFAGAYAGPFSYNALGDVDGDGDLDFVRDYFFGNFEYYENTGSAQSAGFALLTGSASPLSGVSDLSLSVPALGDSDGDGDLDIVAGTVGGGFGWLENTIVRPKAISALELSGPTNPLDGEDAGQLSAPALGDLDGDGDLDLVAGELDGGFRYFENTRDACVPSFVERTGSANPLDGEDVGDDSMPALGDLDGDGDLDLVTGEYGGTFFYYENTGDATSPAFSLRTDDLGLAFVGNFSAPALADLDADGDLDVIAGTGFGTFYSFENIGGATIPDFDAVQGFLPYLFDIGRFSTPAFGKIDRDGAPDVVAGRAAGSFVYHKNLGTPVFPAVLAQTGSGDPFDGLDVGDFSAPALGDLDCDGDLDLVTGEADGSFRTYYLPEPGRGWLLGAGASLLHVLERWRRRRGSRASREATP